MDRGSDRGSRFRLPALYPRSSDPDGDTFVASTSPSAVRPPPPMAMFMQAAFAAFREQRAVSLDHDPPPAVGYDDAVASMRTSWEADSEAAARPWIPASSPLLEQGLSAVCPAPHQPALVAAALAQCRRARPAAPAAPPSKSLLTKVSLSKVHTSWEIESQLLHEMHRAGTASTGSTLDKLAGAGSTELGELSELKRIVGELDAMWGTP
jgi:hypothetical protein